MQLTAPTPPHTSPAEAAQEMRNTYTAAGSGALTSQRSRVVAAIAMSWLTMLRSSGSLDMLLRASAASALHRNNSRRHSQPHFVRTNPWRRQSQSPGRRLRCC